MKLPTPKTVLLAGACAAVLLATAPKASAFIVFDPRNYVENMLSAVRALDQIDNQVKQLTNEAQMLMKMDLNLDPLGTSVSGDLQSSLDQIKTLLDQADGIKLSVSETEAQMQRLFPSEYGSALSGDQSLRAAEERWTETLDAFKRTMDMEAKVTETTTSDGTVLSDLLSKSGSAVGNLEVQQAGNELLGLSVKQQLQVQTLLAANQRATSLNQARELASQEESRLRFQSFLGDDTAYTP